MASATRCRRWRCAAAPPGEQRRHDMTAIKLPPVDAVLVGFGWTGAILGQELTDAGLTVLALERGAWRDTPTDFAPTFIQDELRYYYRHALFEEPARETLTFRNNMSETALPMRKLGSFLPDRKSV